MEVSNETSDIHSTSSNSRQHTDSRSVACGIHCAQEHHNVVEITVVDRKKKKTLILGSLDFKTTTKYDIYKIPMHVVNICL